jgi:N-acetylmuramoyl-L-alanine amidase CwlA
MIINEKFVPIGHPNRPGWKREGPTLAFVIHSTANLWPGAGDEWHAKYFARQWQMAKYNEFGKTTPGMCEAGPLDDLGYGTKFRVGCTHLAADQDSVTYILPLDEYAPGAGDRTLQYDEQWKGQKALARYAFGNRQNYRTTQIEVCENADGDWLRSLANARDWVINECVKEGLSVDRDGSIVPESVFEPPMPGRVLIVRHYDITGKNCPSRLVKHQDEWENLVNYIAAAVNGGRP